MSDIQRIVNKAVEQGGEKALRNIVLTLWTSFVKYTPVDTGRARAGWFVSKDRPTNRVPPEGEYSVGGKAPLRRVQQPLPSIEKGLNTWWIVNNVEYISVLDQGRSTRDGQMRGSKQAPNGMTALGINDLKRAFRIR